MNEALQQTPATDFTATDAPAPDSLRGFVAETLAAASPDAWTVLHLPAPRLTPERTLARLVRALPTLFGEAVGATAIDHGLLWAPQHGAAVAAVGAAATLQANGTRDRCSDLRRQADELFARLHEVSHPDLRSPTAQQPTDQPAKHALLGSRLYGGLAFAPRERQELDTNDPWAPFGDGSFVLPRLRYAVLPAGDGANAPALLTVTLAPTDRQRVDDAWLDSLEMLLDDLGRPAAPRPKTAKPSIAQHTDDDLSLHERLHQRPLEEWTAQIEAIRDAIRDGRFEKIVAARRAELDLPRPLDPIAVLERLSALHTAFGGFRFAFHRAGISFLGVTPERLIRRHGLQVETEALAGSAGLGDAEAERLLASPKEQGEHAWVVRHIVERLEPLCRPLHWDSQPRLLKLRHVVHLQTPIRGRLIATPAPAPGQAKSQSSTPHVLDLVETLHPTPAVGGVPTADAVRWIVERESTPRGWYAGPVGWFDANGDGEFAVALRSSLLTPDTAYLFAGAGIVADSDPELEYRETAMKQQAILSALVSDNPVSREPGPPERPEPEEGMR